MVDSEIKWHLTFVYSYPIPGSKDLLWHDLTQLHAYLSLTWCCIGDFNAIRSLIDKLGGNVVRFSQVSNFKDFINSWALLELPYNGLDYTCFNKRFGH